MNNFDVESVTENCIEWIRDWFFENGKDCKAVIGISGGKDSSVVAALCVKALGKENVFGVLMPNGFQSDISNAHELVSFLGIKAITINIKDTVLSLRFMIESQLNKWSEQSNINLPARIRMSTLYAVSQTICGRVMNTCNLSEDWVGYSSRWGDAVGDCSPLATLTSDEVVAIGEYLRLPDELTHKVPSDGLCGKTDEDNLGFKYEVLNRYLRTGEIDDEEVKNRIDYLHNKNLFKIEPIPCFDSGLKIIAGGNENEYF